MEFWPSDIWDRFHGIGIFHFYELGKKKCLGGFSPAMRCTRQAWIGSPLFGVNPT